MVSMTEGIRKSMLLLSKYLQNTIWRTKKTGAVQERQASIWAKPQLDQDKVNCDASWSKESGKVGLGFVARNPNGEVLLSSARGECFANSPLEAEAKAILWAMSHARSRRLITACCRMSSSIICVATFALLPFYFAAVEEDLSPLAVKWSNLQNSSETKKALPLNQAKLRTLLGELEEKPLSKKIRELV
ncbi:reverse transcriptase [Tanacetum coccineum]